MEIERLVHGVCRQGWIFQREQSLQRLKTILQEDSKSETEQIFVALSSKLDSENLQIRYLAFEAIDRFFTRSKIFREICCERIGEIVQLCLANEEPEMVPQQLVLFRDSVLDSLIKWKHRFGRFYMVLEMTCEYIESTLKLTLDPSVRRANNAQVSPKEQEERERNCRRYEPVLLKYKAIIQDCQCTYSETLEALSIVESTINWIEWEEIECPLESTDYTAETGVQAESTGLGSYKANTSNSKKGVSPVSVTERFVEMDPVMKEVLSDFSAIIQKRHIAELQELITACLRLNFSNLTISRSAVLHQAVQIRNQLQEIISRISDLGIEVEKQSSKSLQHQLEPLDGPSTHKRPRRKLSVSSVDPTKAKKGAPYVLEASTEEIQSRSEKRKNTQILNSEAPVLEQRRTLSSDLTQSLLRQAPRLNEVQTRTQLQKSRWRSERRSDEDSRPKRIHQESSLPERHLSVREADRLYNERIISGASANEQTAVEVTESETRKKRRKNKNSQLEKIKRWIYDK
eukprot:g4168.t1